MSIKPVHIRLEIPSACGPAVGLKMMILPPPAADVTAARLVRTGNQ